MIKKIISFLKHPYTLALLSNILFILIGLEIKWGANGGAGAALLTTARIFIAFPFLLILIYYFRREDAIAVLKYTPKQWLARLMTGGILLSNVVIFAAAPLIMNSADGLGQGYLILPTTLFILGVILGEKVLPIAWFGAVLALVGALYAAFDGQGGLSYVAIYIALSQTIYFYLHKKLKTPTNQKVLADFAVTWPFSIIALVYLWDIKVIVDNWLPLGSLGITTGLAYICYLGASSALPHTVFGILTLGEPLGLMWIAAVFYQKAVSWLSVILMTIGGGLTCIVSKEEDKKN